MIQHQTEDTNTHTAEDTNTPTKRDDPKESIRPERSSQTDDEEQQQDGVKLCFDKLKLIKEKLDNVFLILPEFDHFKARVATLEEEKQSMSEYLQFMQEDINELKAKVESTTASLQEADKELAKLSDWLERRQIKQECYKRRNNIKFFGIKDSDKESERY